MSESRQSSAGTWSCELEMARYFVLLEILDPAINAFLWKIRQILNGRRSSAAVHLTLRGPYEEPVPGVLRATQSALKYDVLRISEPGRFANPDGEVVFLRVDSPNLRSVWWKPSFPIERFGFAPHISLYRGTDSGLAAKIHDFLATERFSLLCAEHQIVWYQSGQPNLFSPRDPTVGDMEDMFTSNRIDVTLLDRLEDLVGKHRLSIGSSRF